MIALAWILLLNAATKVELTDEVYRIPRNEWWWVEVNLRQKPAQVLATYEVQSGPHKVRVALMTRDDLERLNNDLPHGVLAVSEPAKSGSLAYRVRRRGDYVLLVDNRVDGSQPAAVHLRIALDFAGQTGPEETQISPQRQLTVIVMSFAFFAGVAAYSAKRLWRARRGA
jgi:hypothetical protein